MSKQALPDEADGKKSSAKCYNCGAEDHFMMACPEPTRQVPAGLAAARAAQAVHPTQASEVTDNLQHSSRDQRPHKRPKTMSIVTRFPPTRSGPVITRYTPRPSQAGQESPSSIQGYYDGTTEQYQQQHFNTMPYSQPYSQETSPQVNTPYAQYGPQQSYGQPPVTSYDEYSQSSPGLPHHTQSFHTTASQQYYQAQNATYQYQGYPTYGCHQPPPGQFLQQQQPYYQHSSAPYQEPVQHWDSLQLHPSPQVGPASQTSRLTRHHNYQNQKHRNQHAHHSNQRRQSRLSFQNLPSGSTPNASNFQQNSYLQSNGDADFEWNLEKSFVEIIHPEADPVAQPLPAIFSDEPILSSHNTPGVTLKYVRPINLEVFCLDIRKTLHWPMLKSDPVFKDINYDSELVPLDKVDEWLQNRPHRNKITNAVKFKDSPRSSSRKRAWSDDVVHRDKHINSRSYSTFAPGKSRKPAKTRRTPSANEFPSVFDRSSTPVYARPGTPSLGAEDDVWAPQPGERFITNSPPDSTEARLASLGVTGSPKPLSKRQSKPGRGSYSKPSANEPDHSSTRCDRRQSYSADNPPPPPPSRLRRRVDGPLENSQPNGPCLGHALAIVPHDHHHGRHQAKPPLMSVSTDVAENENKVQRDGNHGKKIETPRPIDNVTTRPRNSQPKVAEAYNRRW